MRVRVGGVIPMENGFAFMHRKGVENHPLGEYYVFAGGGLEGKESLEEGVKREIEEEFGILVDVEELLYTYVREESPNQQEYYFLCKYVSGIFGTGKGPEFSNDPQHKSRGRYLPEIVAKENIEILPLVPPEVKASLLRDIENGRFDNYLKN